MITLYRRIDTQVAEHPYDCDAPLPPDTLWIDLLHPTDAEKTAVEKQLGIAIPDRTKMQEIEASSRLYSLRGMPYLTVDILSGFNTPDPVIDALLIIVTPATLVTVRYNEPYAVKLFARRIVEQPELFADINAGLLSLLDAITDRSADILEVLGRRLDDLSRQIFRDADMQQAGGEKIRKEKRLQLILQGIGQTGDITHKMRDSINGMMRLVSYLSPRLTAHLTADQLGAFQALERDVRSLADHVQFVAQEIAFLLDASLGYINIEQNNIIKIFSVVAVVFLPPTLFASIWGMNFHNIPELSWVHGYYVALVVMIISAILPLVYFKRRGWL